MIMLIIGQFDNKDDDDSDKVSKSIIRSRNTMKIEESAKKLWPQDVVYNSDDERNEDGKFQHSKNKSKRNQ